MAQRSTRPMRMSRDFEVRQRVRVRAWSTHALAADEAPQLSWDALRTPRRGGVPPAEGRPGISWLRELHDHRDVLDRPLQLAFPCSGGTRRVTNCSTQP